jgi:hypothetical protein
MGGVFTKMIYRKILYCEIILVDRVVEKTYKKIRENGYGCR